MAPTPTPPAPPVIGLVGGIGAGKSAVAAALRELGCVVCDSDALAREALGDPTVVTMLRERWADRRPGPVAADGSVERRAVAAIVFGDVNERRWLESITHPWIEARRRALFAAAPAHAPALVIDAPLLLEAGLGDQCDAVIFVDAPRTARMARVRSARGWDEGELLRRERSQWPLERKRSAATDVIVNDGDLHDLRRGAVRVLDRLVGGRRRREPDPPPT